MKQFLMKRREGTVALIVVFLLVLIATFLYVQWIVPERSKLTQAEALFQIEKSELQLAKSTAKPFEEESPGQGSLQEVLPVQPRVEEVLLEINRAELSSGVAVSAIQIGDDEMISLGEGLIEQLGEYMEQDAEGETATSSGVAEVIRFSINGTSSSYRELDSFLTALENSTRFNQISYAQFTVGTETTGNEGSLLSIPFTVDWSVYYMPSLLEQVESLLPPIDSPAPAGRENPLN
ncbi:hypothetical protein [Bacillus fonticola]|uniref:hypothetical protein n=1 Tax=Bacillus fonticola TaxID=2728853 RepID=UPI001475F2A8|nr:hypothetical protein [Bacillus fonticola]